MIALTQEMSVAIACPGEELIEIDTVCDNMYVVLRGHLELLVHGTVMSVMTDGACIGSVCECWLASGECGMIDGILD